jgi:hypothetical protein
MQPGPLLRACQGRSCPLSCICGPIAVAPNCADFTVVQIAAIMAMLAGTCRHLYGRLVTFTERRIKSHLRRVAKFGDEPLPRSSDASHSK